MGNCIRNALKRLRKKQLPEKNIVLLIAGIDNAGKTLVLNHISCDPDKNVLPTMGFRTVSLRYKSYSVKIYDLGGSPQIRSLWPKYYNDIHGLIYVVDASDISRLTENKVVFGELVSHEHISGKPLLLLANKQDLNGAIDELDLVENLDVEHVANAMRCPTRVETCSCIYEKEHSKNSTVGIMNGYRWLLDTIAKDYTALNNRIKKPQVAKSVKPLDSEVAVTNSPSRLSIHSNPFKPIKELLSKQEEVNVATISQNGVTGGKKLKRFFMSRNKTAPSEHLVVEFENVPKDAKSTGDCSETQTNVLTATPILNSLTLDIHTNENRIKQTRPYTAPERSQRAISKMTVINIPGQVLQL